MIKHTFFELQLHSAKDVIIYTKTCSHNCSGLPRIFYHIQRDIEYGFRKISGDYECIDISFIKELTIEYEHGNEFYEMMQRIIDY